MIVTKDDQFLVASTMPIPYSHKTFYERIQGSSSDLC